MRLALLGATGGIGGHLLAWAVSEGHDVHVLARRPELLARPRPVPASGPPSAGGLTITVGDSLDPGAVAEVIAGADAVLSALGPRGPRRTRTPSLLAESAANVIAGMDRVGVRRLINVSAAGAFITGDPDTGALTKAILPRILAAPFADVREMEAAIRASDLDWTLVRATRLVNQPATGRYRVRADYPPPGGRKICRADVAHFTALALTEDAWLHSAPALAY
ncbi:MAG TPA: NAD(P)-binding oxidoreductase [Streptosporangiaceae bacterium]|nr:NAD(P)-binding oxidoreductase [Streptosporangiaceae bacterium]